MVNKVCDFCCNSYRVNPKAGYFRVTRAMLVALGLDSQGCVQRDFICGLHFGDDCFKEDGKLKIGSIPTFFLFSKVLPMIIITTKKKQTRVQIMMGVILYSYGRSRQLLLNSDRF